MKATLIVHIALGILSLLAGYIALYSAKGGTTHRRSGKLFVYAMIPMALGGLLIAVVRNVAPAINVPAALLTSYLVITSLLTVRPPFASSRWLNPALMLIALGVGLADVVFTMQAFANGGTRNGMPAFPFIMFGAVGLIGAAGDFRMMRSGPLQGPRRLARHLWRMSFALFIAALSFFIGQARVLPEVIRIRGLLAMPVLAVLVTMFYWLWRVRRTKRAARPVVPILNGVPTVTTEI